MCIRDRFFSGVLDTEIKLDSSKIVVLPFKSLSDTKKEKLLALGISLDLGSKLTKSSKTLNILNLKKIPKDLKEVFKSTNASYLVDGNIMQIDNMLRVKVDLIDGKNISNIWSETYDRDLTGKNIFKLQDEIIEKIIKPTLKGLQDQNIKYKGFLYAGLMIVNNEPYLIEYNVRMGDPECQTILPMLYTDLLEIIESTIDEKLENIEIQWLGKKSLCVVLCSNGYPDHYEKNIEIKNLNKELDSFKKTIEENNSLYESMLDKTTQSLEKIISNTESLSKIQ